MKRLALIVLCTACANAGPREFALRYERETGGGADAPQCAGFSKVVVHDIRGDKKTVGERQHEDGDKPASPITLSNDPVAWAKDGIESQSRYSQFLLGDPNKPTLDVSINTIDMQEKVFQNGSYSARIILDVIIIAPNGQHCVTGSFEGIARNYGQPGEGKNYNQTMNRSLDAAATQMFGNTAVREAACRCMGGN